jgi:hypothetical protein
MAKRTKFVPVKAPEGWRLNIPAKFSESGKRERHFYKTRDDALEAALKLREKRDEFGEQSKSISPSLAEQAHQANLILAPWGKSLVEAARFMAGALAKDHSSQTLDDAAAKWIASCEDELRETTLKSYGYTVQRLKEKLSGRTLSAITAEELEAALKTHGGTSYDMHRRNARALWRWAAKPPRRWCDPTLFESVSAPRRRSTGDIEVLSPHEAKSLLSAAEKHFPQTVCIYAVALFAGIRSEELQRLEAGHVKDDGIEIPKEISKKSLRRHVPMNPTLRKWLEAYPFAPCPNWKEADQAVRRLAGWDVAARLLKHPPEPKRGAWPQNVMRHTHASASVANGATLENLLFSFGHSNGPEILKRHYVGRYSKKEAIAFWSIGPKGTKIPNLQEVA